jgi:hypothetical protein
MTRSQIQNAQRNLHKKTTYSTTQETLTNPTESIRLYLTSPVCSTEKGKYAEQDNGINLLCSLLSNL